MKHEVRKANVDYHSRMAETYDRDSVHYAAENRDRVGAILADLSARTGRGTLLDLGCGTGFVSRLAAPHFDRVVAVDMTRAMIRQVSGGPRRVLGELSGLPFSDGQFDAVACYGTLHHLYDPERAVAEACRCLRPGGLFYSDSDPNAPFFAAIRDLPAGTYSEIVQREIVHTAHEAQSTAEQYRMDLRTVELAEYQKIMCGRFRKSELERMFAAAGFEQVTVAYEWFLGQAAVMHGASFEQADRMAAHLRACLPVSEGLFKYLKVIARKGVSGNGRL